MVFGSLGQFHFDPSNDYRLGYQWLNSSTTILPVSDFSSHAQQEFRRLGFGGTHVLIGFLVYTRWIVGSCVDRIQKGNSRDDEGFQHLISSIQDENQEFLYESFVQNKNRFIPLYQSNQKEGTITPKRKRPERWLGKFASCPESMSQLLLFSSFLEVF